MHIFSEYLIQYSAIFQIRHLAAVEVRKLIQKEEGQMWELLDSQVRESIKNNILAITVNEKRLASALMVECFSLTDRLSI